MSRRSKRKQSPAQTQSPVPATISVPWYKRAWVVISTISAASFLFLLNAPTVLQNVRKLPDEARETYSQYRSWVKEDTEWTGHWSSFPEGVVDMADMRLSNVDMQITIWASQGEIDGTIATKVICRSIPVLNFVLLRGHVNGDTATVTVWDIVEGQKTDFAELKLVREGDVLTVTPLSGRKDWFPATARLGRHPREANVQPEPDSTFCAQEMKDFINKMHSQPGK